MSDIEKERDQLGNFINMIQSEVLDDIKEHVLTSDQPYQDVKIALEYLPKPVVNYVVAMVLDNLLRKDLIITEDIINND